MTKSQSRALSRLPEKSNPHISKSSKHGAARYTPAEWNNCQGGDPVGVVSAATLATLPQSGRGFAVLGNTTESKGLD